MERLRLKLGWYLLCLGVCLFLLGCSGLLGEHSLLTRTVHLFIETFRTNQPTTHFMIPISAGVPFGLGMLLVFTSVTAYLMDTYKTFTASALAAVVVLRSVLAALFPLFIAGLFRKIGNQWGASIFAFLALACMPLPYLFYVSTLAFTLRMIESLTCL
jgi:hypothetical protein